MHDNKSISNTNVCPAPIVLLLDTSNLMRSDLDIVNSGLKYLKHTLSTESSLHYTRSTYHYNFEIAVITCGGTVEVIHDWSRINEFNPPQIVSNGLPVIKEAITKACNMISCKKIDCRSYWKPQIFLVTNGKKNEDSEPIGMISFHSFEDVSFHLIELNHNTFEEISRIAQNLDTTYSYEDRVDKVVISDANEFGIEAHNEDESFFFTEEAELVGQKIIISKPYIFGASVIGPSHIKNNIPCQDSCDYGILSTGCADWAIIAVADGLGSAKKSDIGSKIAVETAVSEGIKIIEHSDSILDYKATLRQIIKSSRDALEKCSIDNKFPLRDLACTLIVALYFEKDVFVAHIGDGGVVAKIGEDLSIVSEPGESEYLNEVIPLTSKNWEDDLRISSKFSNVQSLAVFTDGCQRAALIKSPTGFKPFEGFFNPIFNYSSKIDDLIQAKFDIEELLSSQKLKDNSEDDKTLVILTIK